MRAVPWCDMTPASVTLAGIESARAFIRRGIRDPKAEPRQQYEPSDSNFATEVAGLIVAEGPTVILDCPKLRALYLRSFAHTLVTLSDKLKEDADVDERMSTSEVQHEDR